MSKVFAWIMGVLAVIMLLLQLLVAAEKKPLVIGFWILILALCIYALFVKKPPKA